MLPKLPFNLLQDTQNTYILHIEYMFRPDFILEFGSKCNNRLKGNEYIVTDKSAVSTQ